MVAGPDLMENIRNKCLQAPMFWRSLKITLGIFSKIIKNILRGIDIICNVVDRTSLILFIWK